MGTRAFAIVNPAAGAGATGRSWPGLATLLSRLGLELDAVTTTRPREATELARRAVAAGHSLVVAVGGDGTVNEVVNGITGADGRPLATLGVIATGRGRDVCRNFGIPRAPDAAARALVGGRETVADLGHVELPDGPRFFVNAIGAGFDADVARRAQGRRGPGTVPYLVGVFQAVAHHRARPVAITGDVTWSGPATAVVVANGAFYGGGMKIAPAAAVADGALDLVLLGDFGRLELVRWLPSVYRGTHVRHPRVVVAPVRALRIAGPMALPVHVDGEPAGTTPISVGIRPRALRLRR